MRIRIEDWESIEMREVIRREKARPVNRDRSRSPSAKRASITRKHQRQLVAANR